MAEFEERFVRGVKGAKRATVVHIPWMGDWFASYSPRNSNSNAEGTWDHWVQIALSILQHPATAVVRPEAHEAVKGLTNTDFYDESARDLTDDEIADLFPGDAR